MGVKLEAWAWCLGLVLLSACATREPPPPPPEPPAPVLPTEIRVGLLLPLSGRAADLGQDMLRAAEMALFDVGANDLVLLPRDTQGTAVGAREAAQQVIDEGAEVILGPLFSQAVTAVSPLAAQAGIRVLAFSNVAGVASPGTYLLGFRPEEQVERVVRYAVDHLERVPEQLPASLTDEPDPLLTDQQDALDGGAGTGEAGAVEGSVSDQFITDPFAARPVEEPLRVAGLAPDDAYGATTMEVLRTVVTDAGGELSDVRLYPPGLADPSAVVRAVADYDRRKARLEREVARFEAVSEDEAALAQAEIVLAELETLDTLGQPPFDAIMVADGGDRLRSVAALLNFFDVDPAQIRYLGTLLWQDDPRVLREAALQGGWYAAPDPASVQAFQDRFAAAFGEPPPQPTLVGLAYDATALAVIVAQRLDDRSFGAANLTNPEGFAGVTGLFRLREDGLADHGLAILEVASGEARTIDPPPARFPGPEATLGF